MRITAICKDCLYPSKVNVFHLSVVSQEAVTVVCEHSMLNSVCLTMEAALAGLAYIY